MRLAGSSGYFATASLKMALPVLALSMLAAAPADTGLRDRIVADAAAVPPAALAFDRTTRVMQTGGSETASQTRVDRWDGKSWTVVSVDGKVPAADDVAKSVKTLIKMPVPGYYRLAALLAKAVPGADSGGRIVLRAATLPAGSVFTSGKDVSEHFTAAAVVAPGARPYVEHLRLASREPFRMMLVASIESLVAVSDYRLDAAGRPRLVSQVTDVDGSILGRSGVQHSEVTFSYR